MAFINEGARGSLTALSSATSANGTDRNGATLGLNVVHPGTLVVDCTVTIVTGSVVCTIRHEVSNDASTWVPLVLPNNAANVTVTASATRAVSVPEAASAFRYYRAVMTLSGAATAGGDLTAATYRYLRFNELDL